MNKEVTDYSLDQSIIKKREFTEVEAKNFYSELLERALQEITNLGENPVMLCGKLFTGDQLDPELCAQFEEHQSELEKSGLAVFNQIPYLDAKLEEAPFKYDLKFEIFYKGLIGSGLIKKCYFIPGWENAKGTLTEKRYCEELDVPLEILK